MGDWEDPLAGLNCGENPQGELSTRLEINNGRHRMVGGADLSVSGNEATIRIGGSVTHVGEIPTQWSVKNFESGLREYYGMMLEGCEGNGCVIEATKSCTGFENKPNHPRDDVLSMKEMQRGRQYYIKMLGRQGRF